MSRLTKNEKLSHPYKDERDKDTLTLAVVGTPRKALSPPGL